MKDKQTNFGRVTRRAFVLGGAGAALNWPRVAAEQTLETRQASGVKAGEVTSDAALVWVRLTAAATRNNAGVVVKKFIQRGQTQPLNAPVNQLEGACPGRAGLVRVRYGTRQDLMRARATAWVKVGAETDFSAQLALTGLQPATTYYYATETAELNGKVKHGALRGQFQTAPRANVDAALSFCVLSCQMYAHLDHADGFNIYPAMQRLNPQFVVFTGDNVYYDNEEPRATTVELARYHWERMYSLPRHVELLRYVASYWEKDDHDVLEDDAWPATTSKRMQPLTFAEGQRVYRQQAPLGAQTYRSFRWGKHLQFWLTEGRDFRSPNVLADGADKSVWGREQKEWLKRTLRASDATWKVVISPTPLVGPDRADKNDNHTNPGFMHEGSEMRQWLQANVPDNCFVICGDRHWQYHSAHPETGLHEFCAGAASDEHAGGTPGEDKRYHRFHRVKGGFVSVSVNGKAIVFRHHDVNGQVVYEWQRA